MPNFPQSAPNLLKRCFRRVEALGRRFRPREAVSGQSVWRFYGRDSGEFFLGPLLGLAISDFRREEPKDRIRKIAG